MNPNEDNKYQHPTGKNQASASSQNEGKNANKGKEGGSNAPDNTSGSGDSRQAKISLPTGGGAIRGIGEKFQANPVTGTASFSVPLTISPGRGEFTPQLALSYDSGSGNSIFGLGWNIGLPSITRKTDKGLPQYNDNPNYESDTFILSGTEDLVPVLQNGQQAVRQEGNYDIYTYMPRTEGLFALIERWTDRTTYLSHWRTVSKENITSIFGFSPQARIADPDNDHRIFSWLLEESWDAKGNLMKFTYKQENFENVPDSCYEKHRPQTGIFANRYLKEVAYGNTAMCVPAPCQSNYNGDFHFRLVLDYGTHPDNNQWIARPDAFSNYKAGFEIRTYRLCQQILMFHNFPELGNTPVLVKSTGLEYEITPSFSLLQSVTHKAYENGSEDSFPPLTFSYTEAVIANTFKEVPEEMLRSLPAGVDGQGYQWADLYSEGISGILTMNNQAWYFKPNYGDSRFTDPQAESNPVLGNMHSEVPKPSAANKPKTSFGLNDVDSDGFPELVIQGDGINGFYSRDEEENWQNFRNFEQYPNINFGDSNLRFMDLTGDGLADIVISKGETFDIYFSEGKKGFGNYRRVRCGTEQDSAPQVVFSDPKQTIFLADMDGDGLTDIVKITHNSIVYWPNMGYGKFGSKVVMSNPPLLDSTDQFDARYIHLTDVDGTGTTDLLYISKGGIRYYKNLAGNAWEEQTLPSTLSVTFTRQHFIQTTDLLGNGTQCVVLSSSMPAQAKRMRYWELTSGIKPFLLREISNNMGGITRLHYAPSTKFYMQDKLKGTPWITKLPFPVQVLEKVEIIDHVAEKYFTNRYAYHHGYYDPVEREFRGFGMVEQWDTEKYDELMGECDNGLIDFVPPVYTRTWFHTGFYSHREKISRQYEREYFQGDTQAWQLPDTVLPEGLSGEEAREACRALKGSPLRVEVYAQDGTELEAIPYTVEEKSSQLQCLQPKGANKHAVFMQTEGEGISYHYERNTNDPRILHKLVLEIDEYGNEKKSIQIAYPRREDFQRFDEQRRLLASYAENDFINHTGNNERLIGIPFQNKQYEIHHLPYAGEKIEAANLLSLLQSAAEIDYAAIPAVGSLQKRLIQHQRNYFWNTGLTAALPLGEIAPHALPYQQQSLELTQKLIDLYNSEGEKIEYVSLSDTYFKYLQDGTDWFAVSEVQHFDYEDFYLPKMITDPFGNITQIEYDEYSLSPVEVTDALNFKTTAEYNYRVLQPYILTDPNGNSQEVKFDILGMVTALAVKGKNGEGDTLTEPTEKYSYDLHCWKNEQKPVCAHMEKREVHGVPSNVTRWLESYVYTDGLGNEIMTKTTAADGLAWGIVNNVPIQDNTTTRWLASGKVIYNNKGLAVKQYEPWFSDTHEFTFEDELTHFGVTPIMYYDPLGRLIQTDFPDGSTNRVEFDAWRQKNFDQNDCDDTSPHYNTPQVLDLDILGRVFQTTDDNSGFGDSCVTHTKLDITGRIIAVTDGLGRVATQNMYALSEEHLLTVDNIDSRKRWLLNDTAGKLVLKWDSRQYGFLSLYDELQRKIYTLFVDNSVDVPTLGISDIITYGTDSATNSIGQITEICAQDGKTAFEYDFKGNVILLRKQFTEDYTVITNWGEDVELQDEQFVTETSYDALNRPVTITNPDESTLYYGYDKGGLLNFVQRNDTEVHISNIEYNEKGQRLNIYYGNNTKTKYEYNPLNFRLTRILTTRNSGADILQDLNYDFDTVGNIIKQTDNAQQTFYFNNQVIAPVSTYEYDALYRLIHATGRELTALQMPTQDDFVNNIPCPNPAANAMQNYTQHYQYDALGNILNVTSQGSWSRDYIYDTATNRLLKHDSQQTFDDYTYDEHGNMLSMPHLLSMEYDYKDELFMADNGTYKSYYNYDAQGNRTRKVVVKGNIREERYYVGGYEVYKKYTNTTLDYERKTVNTSDDEKVFVRLEQKTGENVIVRYQYDNHLGSACLELDSTGQIISYEEYHPFGTTSYRSGRSETEVSLKRYKYCGKERDEETGLYYYGMRYYAVWLCRFVSVDPLQFKYPELTPFQYASNRPITMIDLDGLEGHKPKYEIGFDSGVGTKENPIKLETVTVIDEESDSLSGWYINYQGFYTYSKDGVSMGGDFGECTYAGESLPEGVHRYKVLISVEGVLYHKNTTNVFSEFGNWLFGKGTFVEHKKYDRAEESFNEEIFYAALGSLAGSFLIRYAGKAVGSIISKIRPTPVISDMKLFFESALHTTKNGMTKIGIDLQKHVGRAGSAFESISFSGKTATEDGVKVLKNILNSNKQWIDEEINGTKTIYDKVTGRGVNVSRSGKFNGFREFSKRDPNKIKNIIKN